MAYVAVAVEGGFLPSDLLDRIALARANGQRAEDFGLPAGGRLSDEISGAFSDVCAFWDTFERRRAHSRERLTTLTREAWVIPLLERLGFAPVFQRGAVQAGGESYAISHRAGEAADAPPIHITAIEQRLDDRAEGSRRSPHAMVQEYLNRSDALWGIVTNGQRLRLLRDSARLSQPAYLEFDLEGIVRGTQYSEFVLLYRLLHASRFPRDGAGAHDCWLERYYQQGIDEGGRVREHLRDGVERALEVLGSAFLAHPDSAALRDALRSGALAADAYYRELLRLIYRLLFLMVVEERKLVFPPTADPTGRRDIYTNHYGVGRLRQRCERPFAHDRYPDLWQGLLQTCHLLRVDDAAGRLGLTALDSELFGGLVCQHLEAAGCANADLLLAIFHLSTFADGRVRRRVNYAGLDVEELGSVYESLLDYRPHVDLVGQPRFELQAGSERRQTGSYYTPPELVRELIDHALVPVVEERLGTASTQAEKERALLAVRVCDPASGSGHFLLAAARRIARELAKVRTGEAEPGWEPYHLALREVIRQCIYAVDRNPLAVDLCKVALWLEGHSAGLTLSFLDAHVKCGDSLVGVLGLAALEQGIPDAAYAPLAGESKADSGYLLKRNRAERERGQLSLDFGPTNATMLPTEFAAGFAALDLIKECTPAEVHEKQTLYESLRGGDWWTKKEACDLWTAAFFAPKSGPDGMGQYLVPTTQTVRAHLEHPNASYGPLLGEAAVLAQQYEFFHWGLEFPQVFEQRGFDVVLGNPPFLGGKRISTELGDANRRWLTSIYPPAVAAGDLCAYFFRRAYDLLKPGGHLGLVATNSIGQGDTREVGLATIVQQGASIGFAKRFVKWPGVASVEVNLVALRKVPLTDVRVYATPLRCLLDGTEVATISSRLDTEPETEPARLKQNEGKSFQGSNIRGIGFVLEAEEVQHLLARDARNGDCIFPYINGEDLNSRPDQSPSRWVIDFHDWPRERAELYPDLFEIVRVRVLPYRERIKHTASRLKNVTYFWRFDSIARELYTAIAPLNRVLARSAVSEQHAIAFVPRGIVYSHALIVFAFDERYHFAVLQSGLHESWLRRNASTMRTDIRYTPTDCFDTFPFPQELPAESRNQAGDVGGIYHEYRRQLMLARCLGLTKTYNLFHNADCLDADIVRLRQLHVELDHAVLNCYGWQDLDPEYGFWANDRGQVRYTVSPAARRAILSRLLELNLKIASRKTEKRGERRVPVPDEAVAVRRATPSQSPVAMPAASLLQPEPIAPDENPFPATMPVAAISPRVTGPDRYRQAAVLTLLATRGQTDQTFGRIKLVKELYFVQEHLGVDLKLDFVREAAGPLDPAVYPVENLAVKQGWLLVSGSRGERAAYHSGRNAAKAAEVARSALGEHLAAVNQLCGMFRPFNTLQMEQWATVHQVWREQRAAGEAPSRASIVAAVLAWKPGRPGFDRASVERTLEAMIHASFMVLDSHPSSPAHDTTPEPDSTPPRSRLELRRLVADEAAQLLGELGPLSSSELAARLAALDPSIHAFLVANVLQSEGATRIGFDGRRQKYFLKRGGR